MEEEKTLNSTMYKSHQTVLTHTVEPNEFIEEIANTLFLKYLEPFLKRFNSPTPEIKYFSKNETAKKLGISLSNLNNKIQAGKILPLRLDGRILFTDEIINKALIKTIEKS